MFILHLDMYSYKDVIVAPKEENIWLVSIVNWILSTSAWSYCFDRCQGKLPSWLQFVPLCPSVLITPPPPHLRSVHYQLPFSDY